jgi:hypothetical protein
MKKRFTEEQIVAILREGQLGSKTVEQLERNKGSRLRVTFTSP